MKIAVSQLNNELYTCIIDVLAKDFKTDVRMLKRICIYVAFYWNNSESVCVFRLNMAVLVEKKFWIFKKLNEKNFIIKYDLKFLGMPISYATEISKMILPLPISYWPGRTHIRVLKYKLAIFPKIITISQGSYTFQPHFYILTI